MTPQELKNSILQLAIQGKLVEQRPEEGTAEELYQQIQAEKRRLVKEGKIKREKPLPEITEDEVPFELPESWKWARIREITVLNPKNDLNDDLEVSFVPMALVDDGFRNSHSFELRKWGEIKKGFTHFLDGDIGIAKITPCFQNRKSVIFRNLKNGCGAGTTELSIVRVINHFLSRNFLLWFFKSAYFIENGIKSFTGTAGQQRIHKDYLSTCLFPLPPLAEQKRIVATIDIILLYIDRYEQAWSRLEAFNKRFPSDMQKSLLQMAIQGKLVEQRPEEGVVENTYPQIQTEPPFSIPQNWKWVKLLDLLKEKPTNGLSPKGVGYETKVKDLTLTATTSGKFKPDAFKYVDIDLEPDSKYWLKNGDLLIQRSNSREFVGTSCVYTGKDYAFIYPDLMMKLQVKDGVNVFYVDYVLKSPLSRGYFMKSASGTSESMPKINQSIVSNTLIPLPPLAEQRRIVAKLEELLPLCERLK